MTVDVVNQQNEKVGSVDLRDEVFGGRVKTDLIHASVVRSNAADRRVWDTLGVTFARSPARLARASSRGLAISMTRAWAVS